MTYLVAAIEHHARKLANAVTRAVVEKCSGYSDYEAGDFLADERAERWRQLFVDAEAEQEVAEPDYVRYMAADKGGSYALIEGPILVDRAASYLPQTPVAGQRGESSPTASEPPELAVGLSDPSPTILQTDLTPSVRGEGSPAEIATFARRPAGEHPTCECWPVENPWTYYGIVEPGGATEFNPDCPEHGHPSPTPGEFAAVAVREVLADHTPARIDSGIGCGAIDPPWPFGHFQVFDDWHDWREHVSAEIQRRIDAAITNAAPK